MKKNALLPFYLSALLAAGLFLAGCPDDPPDQRFAYLRAAGELTVNTVPADTLCAEPGPNFRGDGFDPAATCRQTQKFVLRWERPEDTVDFRGYSLYLDTTPEEKSWKATQGDDRKAAVIIKERSLARDGLVFFFYDGKNVPAGIASVAPPDTLKAGNRRIFGIDTGGRLEEKENQKRFVFALATRHDGGTPGQPQYTYIITGDKFAPAVFKPFITVKSRTMDIDWARPSDPTSFFDPGADSGIILAYELSVRLHGKFQAQRSASFKPSIRWFVGGADRSAAVKESVITTADGAVGRHWLLPDSARAGRGAATRADSLRVEVLGLIPKDSVDVIIYARDSAGNVNERAMPHDVTVIMTDTTRPITPEVSAIDSLTTRNSFVVRWTASRDSADLDGDGVLEPGATPNAGIRSYRLIRSPILDSGTGTDAFDRRDTVITVTRSNAADTVFHDTVRYLPPGRTYLVVVNAVDSSGFVSEADSVVVTTDSIRFVGADSGLVCPPGMVPIPASRFRLGETDQNPAAQNDEKNGKVIGMASFCIEPYEHRDSLGNFMTKVTWQEADSICRALAPEEDSTQLCSEAEWERACEGFDLQQPHLHGIQSERSPAILQASCNQATGDSAMAMSFELRNPICLTNEGVYDMAGNLSEWVRDAYRANAYSSYPDTTMAFGFTFARYGAGDTASIRGGNYLKPGVSASATQNLARCSNRDFPMQIRPLSRTECVDPDIRKVAVIYGEGLANVKCFDDPALRDLPITDMVPDPKDSSLVRYFLEGSSDQRTFRIPPDTAFRGKKPLEVRFTTRSLLEVVFERVGAPQDTLVDTLDAREFRDTSQVVLERILQRESPSLAWSPRRSGGRIEVRRLYAHVITGSKVARANYASRSIGFRCCGKPRPRPPDPPLARRGGSRP